VGVDRLIKADRFDDIIKESRAQAAANLQSLPGNKVKKLRLPGFVRQQ